MAKYVPLDDVSNITGNPTSAAATINTNNDRVEAALDNTLSRDGSTPNTMSADIDLNSNDLLNANIIDTTTLKIGGSIVTTQPLTASDANQISYDQGGTGSVATTVEAKLQEFVSVKDFGAVGDGVTDDRAAIQLALDSGAKRVFFPAGTYLIGSSGSTMAYRATTAVIGLDVPSNVTLHGEGFGSVLKVANSSEACPITADTKTRIGIFNIRIDGNGSNQTSDRAYGLYFLNCTELVLDNVWVHDTYSNTHEFIGCSQIQCGVLYAETTNPGSIGGGPQFEDCSKVTVDSVLGDTYDDLVSIIAHGGNVSDMTFGNINGSCANARALFIGQSNSAAGQRTIREITANVTSNNCGVSGTTAAFTITRGAIFSDINVKVVDRDSYRTFQMAPYDATYHGKVYNCTFDITSYDSDKRAINIIHDDHADTDLENNRLKAIVRNANSTDDASENDAVRIEAGDFWDVDVNINYPSGKTNVGQGMVLGGSTGVNDLFRYSNVRGIITGGNKNLQLNYTDTLNIDQLIMRSTEDANDINLQITANASNTRLGSIVRDGEIEDLSTSTTRAITKMYSSSTQAATSGTGEDDLMSYTLPADWMGKTGVVHIKASGTITGAAGTKTINLYFGAASRQLLSASVTGDWSLDAYVYQNGTRTGQIVDYVFTQNNAVVKADTNTYAAAGTGTITIKLTGECANGADSITQDTMLIEAY